MIPLKLQIKNFVSYGPKTQTIDFEKYNLICLSGKNGHGKSALLDAITWAIWGHARRLAGMHKSDEALMHMGQTTMMVSLDFVSKEQHFRVRREYNLGTSKKNYSSLEFAIIDKQSNTIRPLTDKTIKLTQEKIDKTIDLDYESFINSAFFKQNQSNEFSKKSAKERKEILANILGLNHFENIKKLACEKVKDATTKKEYTKKSTKERKKILENILGLNHFEKIKKLACEKVKDATTKKEYYTQICTQLEKDLANKDDVKNKLEKILINIKEFAKIEEDHKNKLKEIKSTQESILNIKTHIQQIIFEKEQLNLLIKNQTSLLMQEYRKWRHISRQNKQNYDFDKLDTEYNNLISELNSVQNSTQKKIYLQEELFLKNKVLEEYISKISNNFKQDLQSQNFQAQQHKINLENLNNRLKELKENNLQEKNNLQMLKNNLENIRDDYNENFEKIFDKRKTFYNKFQEKTNWIETEIKDINQKISLINNKQTQADCPLCEQNLSDNYKHNLKSKLEKQKYLLERKLHKIISINSRLKELLDQQNNTRKKHEEINILNLKIDNAKKNFSKTELEIIKYKDLIIQENINLQHLKTAINLLESQEQIIIQKDQTSNLLKTEITKLKLELHKITEKLKNYKTEHALINKIQELQELKKEHNHLLKESALQKDRKQNISELCKNTKELKKKQKQKELEYIKLKPIFEKELLLQNQERLIQQKLSQILADKEILILEKGAIQEQVKIIAQKESDYNAHKDTLNTLNTDIIDYKNIAMSLGKDGIQALLIESAIPEIENEANRLLSLMTDNQSHIIIDSLKDLKSGGTKETLDIKISDALGLRPYELFSGGETFKIDFALRIAISKLLTRRAGSSLQTLIIDEGFGSQDEEGLANIMNIIYKTQESFSKIIIVSHLTSMKDQFPVNFLVHKTPQGTLIKVVEQG